MITVRLDRLTAGDQGTFGRITVPTHDGTPGLVLFTGELPDRGNSPNASRIPAGEYDVAWTFSPAFRRFAYILIAVSGRSGIRIHPANLMGDKAKGYRSQLYGCIALGERMGWLDGQRAILSSTPAVRRFESALQRRPFHLEISDEHP